MFEPQRHAFPRKVPLDEDDASRLCAVATEVTLMAIDEIEGTLTTC